MTKENQEVKFLDLDALAPEVAVSITINKKNHAMAEMSVKDFVWAQKLANEQKQVKTEDMSDADYETVMGSMVDVLHRQFPTCPREDLDNLPISKLTALMKFVGKLGAEGAESAISEAAEEGKVELIEKGKASQ